LIARYVTLIFAAAAMPMLLLIRAGDHSPCRHADITPLIFAAPCLPLLLI